MPMVDERENPAAEMVAAAPLEVMAAVIAHDLRDGEWVEVGANLPVPRAGALLAHLTHGPNMTVMLAMTKAYLRNEPVIQDFEYITDVAAMRWAEAYYRHDRLLAEQRRRRRRGVFYCGGDLARSARATRPSKARGGTWSPLPTIQGSSSNDAISFRPWATATEKATPETASGRLTPDPPRSLLRCAYSALIPARAERSSSRSTGVSTWRR